MEKQSMNHSSWFFPLLVNLCVLTVEVISKAKQVRGLFPDDEILCCWEEISPMHSRPSRGPGWISKLCGMLFGL